MASCKKALDEAGNDIEKAVEILRKMGIAKASKRGARETSEGIIKLDKSGDGGTGYIVEINSETDFVSRNEKFKGLADEILNVIKDKEPGDPEALLSADMASGTVKENLDNLSGTIGEKMVVRNFDIVKGETVNFYSHMAGRIGVLIALDKAGKEELARDIAMQVAAANPKYVNVEDVPASEIEKEKEIYREQLLKEGKPENIIDKILIGKINKYFEEVCLVKQEYIKDDKMKVEQILGDVKVLKFIRYSL